MQNINAVDNFVATFSTQLVHCNFDKAKDLCKREKLPCNGGTYKDLLNLLPNSVGFEKCYSELAFLPSRSKVGAPKKESVLKSAYDDMKQQCEKLLYSDDLEYRRIISEMIQYAEIRSRMIVVYDSLYSYSAYNKHWKMEEHIAALQVTISHHIEPFLPKTLTDVKVSIELESGCLFDLLNAQFYLENWNLLLCTSCINSLKAKMTVWEKMLHNRETWKMNLFRSNNFPELYRWMLKFKTFVLEKFSLYFYTVLRQPTAMCELKVQGNKYHLEFLQKFQTLSKKFGHEATSVMLIFDACGLKNWHGPGYCCPLKRSKSESNSPYCVMLRYPEKMNEPSMPTVKKVLVDHFSDILFLDNVVCRYISAENATYFVTSIEEKISLVSYYSSRKDDKKLDIESYMLELACMISCHRIFLALHSSSR